MLSLMSTREPGDAAGPLAGVRVVDLTHARAGPTCTRQLADLGADVIRVSHPQRGFRLGGSDDHNLMRAKRSMLVDLATDAGREVFLRLCDVVDVVVENFRPAVKHRLGIDPEVVWARNPRVVYASISGFGQTGPYADRPAVDQIAQGAAGLMSVTGPPGSGPWRVGIAISDTAAGTFLTQGVLAALIARQRTGRGQWVHTSLIEALINFMDFQAVRWLNDGEVPGQAGNDHPTSIPTGVFPTSDGHINIAAAGKHIYTRFCETLGLDHLLTDPRFAEDSTRSKNRAAINQIISEVTRKQSSSELIAKLNKAGVPCGPINRMDEVFADPQVQHLGMAAPVHHDALGDIAVVNQPVKLKRTPSQIARATPEKGEHTEEILKAYGYNDKSIAEFRVRKIV
jgi:crotonobetainyl-CoA:carnitine CoA-transferase CaiB-like acyl-CoA transferase